MEKLKILQAMVTKIVEDIRIKNNLIYHTKLLSMTIYYTLQKILNSLASFKNYYISTYKNLCFYEKLYFNKENS